MRKNTGFVNHVVHDLLPAIDGVSSRAMFGGHGIYKDGIIFGIIVEDELYFRVNEVTRAVYEARGSHPFVHRRASGVEAVMPYWLVPGDVLDDPGTLVRWVELAVGASKTAKARASSPGPERGRRGHGVL